ncbi:MAG TPA: ROK family transcriptional regulator [Planosporangium sp.]|nr:ROK family transcriptional regulator [Planosporangium sp.]
MTAGDSPRTPQQSRVLRLLRDRGPCSRAELVSLTDISRSRLAVDLDELAAAGLIQRDGPSVSRGGRPSPLVALGEDLRFVGVDLGATSVAVAVANSRLDLIAFVAEPADIRDGPKKILTQVRDLIAKVSGEVGMARPSGIGIGVPGPVSYRDGVPVSPPLMPGWHHYPLRDQLAREYGCPVTVDNDVNLMAVGERWGGVAKGMDDFLFVKIGTGIGSALVMNGAVYHGVAGCAGDIGHIRVDDEPLCPCGSRGCLEATFGGAALARQAIAAGTSRESTVLADRLARQGSLTAVDVGIAAQQGDPVAVRLVRSGGQRLGNVLAGLVNFMNPPLVVVSGGVSRLGHLLLAEIRQTVYSRAMPLATGNLPIVLSEIGETAGVLGGVVAASDQIFSTL